MNEGGAASSSINYPKVKVGEYVKLVPQADGKQEQTCVFCGHQKNSVSFQSTKWAVHLLSCPAAPDGTHHDDGPDRVVFEYLLHHRSFFSSVIRRLTSGTHASVPSYFPRPPPVLKENILKGSNSREVHDAARMIVDAANNPANAKLSGRSSVVGGTLESAEGGGGGGATVPCSLSEFVTITPIDGDTRKTQTCRYCGKSKGSSMFQATKWAVHLLVQCPSAPFSTKQAVLQGSRSKEVFECAMHVEGLKEIASSMLALKSKKSSTATDGGMGAALVGEGASSTAPWAAAGSPAGAAASSSSSSPPPPHKRLKASQSAASSNPVQPPSTTFLRGDYCDQMQADRISMAIVKFLATCALPMVVVESPPFLDLLRTLNATYVDKFLVKSEAFTTKWLPTLFKSVEEQVAKVWTRQKTMKRTLGLETFLESETKVCMFTEAGGPHTTFQECIIESNSESTTNASILLKHLETVAHERNVAVEDHFCAVTLADANMTKIDDEFAKYPKVFVNGCRSHCLETIYKDISNVDEVSQALRDAKLIFEVTSNHPPVLSAFLRHSGGTALVRPGPRNLNEVLQRIVASATHLQALVNDEGWNTYAYDVSNATDFVTLVSDDTTFDKFRCLNKVFESLCLVVKHVERSDFRSSWIFPLFEALMGDVRDWASQDETGAFFTRGTRELVQLTVEDWWRNFNSDHYLVATLCDPAVFPEKDTLPSDWLSTCSKVLQKFFTGRQQLDARQEIMKIVAGTGVYGEEVEHRRSYLSHQELPDSLSKVALVVKQQETFATETPSLLWETVLYREYPLLSEIASRLLVMSTRSNSVERACGARNLSKSCDRFCNKKVYMLLYCHINLRLSNDAGHDNCLEGFLEQAILDQVSDIEQRIHRSSLNP